MHSIRSRALALGATIALLTLSVGAGVVSADGGRDGEHAFTPFHLDKTCAEDVSEPLGYVCTVAHSDFRWIPAGTEIHYLSQTGNVVSAAIGIRNGSTAGHCVWSSDVDAVCTFDTGTGRLREFQLEVVVTTNADQSVWYWDGGYRFGG